MYLVSHFFMTKIKAIPDNLASTSLPQQWHEPRRKTISSEPLLDMIFKKTKLNPANAQAERNAKRNYSMNLKNDLADRRLSSKKLWRIVNSLSGRTCHSEIPAIEHSDTVCTTAKRQSQHLLSNLCRKMQAPNRHPQPQEATVHPRVLLDKVVFKPKDITKILRRRKPDKASGDDLVPSRVLKECCAELASPLCRLFQLCFSKVTLPEQWKTAFVIPVHKRDSKADPTKYRSISLLSFISKVMETVVNKQLQNHLLNNKLISSRQFGFRPHHSIGDLLAILAQTWNASLDRSEEVCIVAVTLKAPLTERGTMALLVKLDQKRCLVCFSRGCGAIFIESPSRLFFLANHLMLQPSIPQYLKAPYLVLFCSLSSSMTYWTPSKTSYTCMLMTLQCLHQLDL